tara:strand:- start:114 stop:746 length:633 start_codon:yes stop_codon:yes gene_type:complete
MSNLIDFYNSKNINRFEGYSQEIKGQTDFLRNIVNNESINSVMEIGFNAGHSAEIFLSSNKNINLISFDIGEYHYVKLGKQFIDKTYPDRHTLIIGNSLDTVPEYFKKINKKFDLIFIDGSHNYEVAKSDLLNCKNLAHDKTIVIMDDTVNNNNLSEFWNIGPTRAWREAKELNIIKEIGSEDYYGGRGQSWGYYQVDECPDDLMRAFSG